MIRYPYDPPLSSLEIGPYITAVVHFYWDRLAQYYKWAITMDQDSYFAKHCEHLHNLGLVTCVYHVHSERLTVSTTQVTGQPHGYTLYNGGVKRADLSGWPIEQFVEDLTRVYHSLSKTTQYCSTPILPPTAHEVAHAFEVIAMIRKWKLE